MCKSGARADQCRIFFGVAWRLIVWEAEVFSAKSPLPLLPLRVLNTRPMSRFLPVLSLLLLFVRVSGAEDRPFGIQVVDAQSGRGVPLVTLTTTNEISHTTDSAGWIAFDEPGLMDREVYFALKAPGYSVEKDGFGFSGTRLTPRRGERAEIRVTRTNVAERVCRLTGQGIYRDSVLLGLEPPLPRPVLNADVTGQDSSQAVLWKNRVFWIWGDTNRPHYPLGNYHATAAWSDLPQSGGLDPAQGVHFEYLADADGKVRPMLPVKEPGAVWLFGMLVAADAAGSEHLVAHYSRWKDLGRRLEHGLAEWDEQEGRFVRTTVLGDEFEWQHPRHHAVRARGKAADGTERDYFYFTAPFCTTRVPATYEDVMIPSSYEALAWSAEAGRHVWQSTAPPITQDKERQLIGEQKLAAEKALLHVADASTGQPVELHGGSVHWNAHRGRWIMIAVQENGVESHLGEVWYAEASEIEGPWRKAVKIASHPRYSFYNPSQRPFLDQEKGRVIYFEGTYTQTFSGNTAPVPRYEYNQLLYRLDLDDPRLAPARVEASKQAP